MNFFLDVPFVAGHHRLRQKGRAKRGDIQHVERRHSWRYDKRQGGHPIQFPSPVFRSIRCNQHVHWMSPFDSATTSLKPADGAGDEMPPMIAPGKSRNARLPRSIAMPGPYFLSHRTTSTVQVACCTTRVDTLPRTNRSTAPNPLVPITIRSAYCFVAALIISSAGIPSGRRSSAV